MSSLWIDRDVELPYYRSLLRPAGAFLDEQHARDVHLLETPTGFTVRYVDRHEPAQVHSVDLSRHVLVERSEQAQQYRRVPEKGMPEFSVEPNSTSYQEVLRSLGHELDNLHVFAIVLDELEGQYLLTYTYQDSSQGLSWHKRMALVGPTEQEHFLAEARSRRNVLETRRRLWFR